jgi:hypothetical protein
MSCYAGLVGAGSGSMPKQAFFSFDSHCTPNDPEFRHGKAYKSVLQHHGKFSFCHKSCGMGVFQKNVLEWSDFCK